MLRPEMHAVVMTDGAVAVMRTLPVSASKDGASVAVSICRQDQLVLASGQVLPLDGDGNAPGGWAITYADPVSQIAKWHPDQRQRVQSHAPIDPATIPADRMFRNAWRHDGAAFFVDMEGARALHKDRMRAARAPLLAQLDVAYDKADEGGDAAGKADVAARKQALRDVTADPAIAAATTADELKAVWPAILGSPPAA
jgi:hypothetical protein